MPYTSVYHAHLAALPAGHMQPPEYLAANRALPQHWAIASKTLLSSIRAAKPLRAVDLGSFFIGKSAGMCRRETAHFQGLCEQEGQLLEFEAASSTVNLFSSCYLWQSRAGEHLGYLFFCYSMFRSASSVP